MLFCDSQTNAAKRRYLQGSFGVMLAYVGLVFASSIMVKRWHPHDWHLFLLAALPSIPLLCFAYMWAATFVRNTTTTSGMW